MLYKEAYAEDGTLTDSPVSRGRILWVDDEVDLLRPHRMLLEKAGYEVTGVMNGQDALELMRSRTYDLVLLDERMPGLRGLTVLDRVRQSAPRLPVVMVTKSEEESMMREAYGRRADDYIVKPTSPRQVLSVVTRLLAGPSLRQSTTSRDFSRSWATLSGRADRAVSWRDWASLYSDLVDWDLRLDEANDPGLREGLTGMLTDVNRGFCDLVERGYGEWVHEDGEDGPTLSVDLLRRFFQPVLAEDPASLFVVMDCMRLDQWRAIRPIISELFEIEEDVYAGILPTVTPFSRNALFSGMFPDELAENHPNWWGNWDRVKPNSFERELFSTHVRELAEARMPTHYERVYSAAEGPAILSRLAGYLSSPSATALVFGFVDRLTHGRSESRLIWEMAQDVSALRSLTTTWFERSPAFEALRLAAQRGVRVLLTTDHGSIHCKRSVTVFAKRDATPNLRYKLGDGLRVENPRAVYQTLDADELRLPPGDRRLVYTMCREDYFFVYPTKKREYQRRYRDSFLHGGVSADEMVLPVALLTPR